MELIQNINIQHLSASLTGMLFTTVHCIKNTHTTLLRDVQGRSEAIDSNPILILDNTAHLFVKTNYFNHKNNLSALESVLGKEYIENNTDFDVFAYIEEIEDMLEEREDV
ncbi:MAG: hypothetical protein GY861_13105 [bacterium]|nr:hypothetical protein [bacterium]